MQKIDLATVKASKATDRKALAILAYDNATASPGSANWRSVADILRLALPAVKAKAAAEPAAAFRFAPWSEHDIPVFGHAKKFGKSPIIVVTFADGEVVRAPAVSLPGKPVNIGRGLRIAFAYYRARMAARHAGEMAAWSDCINIPALVSIVSDSTGAEYDPADCCERTATARVGEFDYPTVTAEATARGLPSSSDDGSLTVADYIRAKYRIAKSRLRLTHGVDCETAAMLAASIEDAEMRASGEVPLVISARRRDIEHAAYLAMHDDEREQYDTWRNAREAAIAAAQKDRDDTDLSDWLADRWHIRESITADVLKRRDYEGTPRRERAERLGFAVMTFWPDLADDELTAPAETEEPVGSAPVAPSFKIPRRFLSSSHLTLVHSAVPVSPSIAILNRVA